MLSVLKLHVHAICTRRLSGAFPKRKAGPVPVSVTPGLWEDMIPDLHAADSVLAKDIAKVKHTQSP